MIALTTQETQIAQQILKLVFGSTAEVKGLQVHGETVVIVTPYALYSIGKDYFRQLVKQFKAEQVQQQAQAELDEYIDRQSRSIALPTVGKAQTTGNYVGAARRTAIANIRSNQAAKIEALRLMRAYGMSGDEALKTVMSR